MHNNGYDWHLVCNGIETIVNFPKRTDVALLIYGTDSVRVVLCRSGASVPTLPSSCRLSLAGASGRSHGTRGQQRCRGASGRGPRGPGFSLEGATRARGSQGDDAHICQQRRRREYLFQAARLRRYWHLLLRSLGKFTIKF